ncbi:McbB family protein [Pseudomonas sp. W4I3]|uniref:McbB family protein n=1 Tax=Pseudomonas sp. W4I3 TaxID=3042294 RepID=UPI002784711A|nr:McbB family protein [Pseudomonas sp. W4I3]MDQ0741026.1 McbB family protein [Pseudomonas sp. W4I3]
MNITVPNYQILNFEKESLVMSEIGVSKVHSQSLLKALRAIQSTSLITKEELQAVLSENGLNPDSAFGFLEKIIPFKEVEDLYFEKIIVVHSWENHERYETLFRQELSGIIEFKAFSDDIIKAVVGFRCFIVLLCHSYDYENLKKLHFDLASASPHSAISVCWPMGGFFCIGQPYIAEVGNPCHFCTVDRLLNNDSMTPEKNSWARVLDFCRARHVCTPFDSLSLFQELIIVGSVVRNIKYFTENGALRKYHDEVLSVAYVRLSDGKVFQESSSHWYMCDCLGRSE